MFLKLGLNKFEVALLSVIFSTFAILTATYASLDVTWILDKFGIEIGTPKLNDIIDYVANGGSIVTAFTLIAGISLPAWVGPVVAAFGVTAA
ncbi:class IIc cyclic bacteriocin [Staphylococcus delphini]|uniref:class IIc cyclic bacteriocin n=1 Tax=Staphylococcus delphini TaxID=53344 RepID=UPI0021D34A37|nr:class IIc cyclic bacteriocin [Staphylococcus delphini]UXS28640.1 class IIc cyclic bacteriocin [Staphylococcus delphini]UXS36240.1 class IIc cyclic bacteriocin [Staphylococcus delphini]UXS43652.1 class IIc cyclic bacteriocin [Staphylococcus delphini]UXV44345.1 class IIc cyclic bacteriocin [Staphylococcus delphini]